MLVLLQDSGKQDQYSTFFGTLRQHAFELDIRGVKDAGLRLEEYGTWMYDHLIVFAPRADGEHDGSCVPQAFLLRLSLTYHTAPCSQMRLDAFQGFMHILMQLVCESNSVLPFTWLATARSGADFLVGGHLHQVPCACCILLLCDTECTSAGKRT